ncbi:MAG: hypothetical protein LQ352_004955 [Teloschistes flavicans]|nr:MAG: hypothetical protein LQ352_004955 [Teloschistes flavicans]
MASSSPSTSPSPFHFLTLPAELRNKIYALLLIQTTPITPNLACEPGSDLDHLVKHPSIGLPNILMTCKQVNSEAAPFLYSRNIFLIGYAKPLESSSKVDWQPSADVWLSMIGSHYAALVHDMIISIPPAELTTLRLESTFALRQGLRRIRVQTELIILDANDYWDSNAKPFLDLIHPFVEAHPSLNLFVRLHVGWILPHDDPEDSESWDAICFVIDERNAMGEDRKVFDIRGGWKESDQISL